MLRISLSNAWLSGFSVLAAAQTSDSTYGQLQATLANAEAAAVPPGDQP